MAEHIAATEVEPRTAHRWEDLKAWQMRQALHRFSHTIRAFASDFKWETDSVGNVTARIDEDNCKETYEES